MNRIHNLFILVLTLCFISSSCEYKVDESKAEKKAKKDAQNEISALQKIVNELKLERQQIIELNEQSLKEINSLESKRLAAERAEQIRIRTDELELQGIYDNKLKKINQRQRFKWDGYLDKQYAELTSTDGKIYTEAKVINVDATGLALQHQNGVSRIPFSLISAEMEKENITDFEKQIEDLKKWLSIETNERQHIRNSAKLDAEAEFK